MAKTLVTPKSNVASDRSGARSSRAKKAAAPEAVGSDSVSSSPPIPVMSAEIMDGSPAIPQAAEPPLTRSLPTREEIAAHAYVLSEARKRAGLEGDEVSDWYQAERELLGTARG